MSQGDGRIVAPLACGHLMRPISRVSRLTWVPTSWIGQRMLEVRFDKARHYGATRMTLEVRVTNSGAHTLYKKLGFVERGLRKGYYTDTNEDAIIMWKDDLGPQKPKAEQVKWMV